MTIERNDETRTVTLDTRTITRRDVEDEERRCIGDLVIGHIEIYRNVIKIHVADAFGEPVEVLTFGLGECVDPAIIGAALAMEFVLARHVHGALMERFDDIAHHYNDTVTAFMRGEQYSQEQREAYSAETAQVQSL